MPSSSHPVAYVRTEEAPRLPPPITMVGVPGWVLANLFSSTGSGILTVLSGAFLLWVGWGVVEWAVFGAVWSGADREVCAVEGAGACWPFAQAKFAQWIYGFYPIGERWRVNACFLVGAAALVPMLIPSAPYKMWNALFLLIAYPLITLILLTGGNFGFTLQGYGAAIGVMMVAAALVPIAAFGLEDGLSRNRTGFLLTGLALLPLLLLLAILILATLLGVLLIVAGLLPIPFLREAILALVAVLGAVESAILYIPGLAYVEWLLAAAGAALALWTTWRFASRSALPAVGGWAAVLAVVLAAMFLLDVDFGLAPVETSQWGGLTVTLVVSVTGIVASLPLGILLALGRRSKMPVVKMFSVAFIELWRGVPLITVLFMASVMLPLFLPEGVNFDKLLRALIGVALFSAAYMAEVVRGGLQAIPRGQFEAAQALGLSYWKMMNFIVLPQALKIVIPGIVNSFISLFKDTTLVSIIGLFDLLGIVVTSSGDAKWASPQTGPTAYFAAAAVFWAFCFGMSRYSIYTERRLHTGYRR
jgi:general L-amino acid transport system permease protein